MLIVTPFYPGVHHYMVGNVWFTQFFQAWNKQTQEDGIGILNDVQILVRLRSGDIRVNLMHIHVLD